MIYRFGQRSALKLASCHPDLEAVARRALAYNVVDFTILWGWRNEEQQNAMVEAGASKTPWPRSRHNALAGDGSPCSDAFDFAPWVNGKIPWHDTHAFSLVAGLILAAGRELGIELRWGADWDRDGLTADQSFMDFGHVERVV